MSALAAFLFAADLMLASMVNSGLWLSANAASIVSANLSDMRARADAITDYVWTPTSDIETWKSSLYNGAAVFPKGVPVKGMPYTLFLWEVVKDSTLSLEEYKKVADKNYSTRAKCVSTNREYRTGPVYGSCCATFVSEVFGGYFMAGTNPRFDSVNKIESCEYARHYTSVKASGIKPGDALSTKGHIIWVADVTDEALLIYEQTPPVAHKVVLPKSEFVNEKGYLYYKGSTYSTVSRITAKGTIPAVKAPTVKTTHKYYAQGAQAEISWNHVANAAYYKVDVVKDGEKIVNGEMTVEESFRINRGEGNYEVTVTAVNSAGSAKSAVCSFKIGKLGTPVIATRNKYYATGSEIRIDWNECEGATKYHINLLKDGNAYYEGDVKTTSYTFSPKDGYYEFSVEAVNENGGLQTALSDVYGFNIGNKRPIIIDSTVKYYANEASVPVDWNDCAGVADFTLRVTKDGEAYAEKTVSGKSSYTLGNLSEGYYEATVSAVESTGEYDWDTSEPYGFYVGKLERPTVTSEKKYYPQNSNALVSWNECEGAVGYHIKVNSDDEIIMDEDISATSCAFEVKSGKYSVEVSSYNNNGGTFQRCGSKKLNIWASSLDLDKPSQTLRTGDSVVFKAVTEAVDPNDSVTWKSSCTAVATVDGSGCVKAVGIGATEITAKLGDMTISRTVEVIPDISLHTLGASIRLSEPYGIRFGIQLDKNDAYRSTKIEEYGTLILPASMLGNNELTMNTESVRTIKAVNILEEDDSHITYTGVLINVPESFFSTNVVGRGYLTYLGADGQTHTLYSEPAVKSFNGVAQAAYDMYLAIENPTASQLEAMKKLEAILKINS